jgi:hypothetical protein
MKLGFCVAEGERSIDGRCAGEGAVENGTDGTIAACVLGAFREIRGRFRAALDNIFNRFVVV